MLKRMIISRFPGTVLAMMIAIGAVLMQKSELFSKIVPLSPLIIAIVLGFVLNNTICLPERFRIGIKFSAKRVLRLAIVFMGFKLSFAEIASVGEDALITISVASISTILFSVWLGMKMKIPFKRSILLGSGVSICGASAVAAVDGVIRSKEEDAAFAIGAITLLGTVFMLVYPLFYHATGMSDQAYALWSGSSIHEVAQVTAAGSAMNNATWEALASSVKMIRVLYIIPYAFILLFFFRNDGDRADDRGGSSRIMIPWFALLFFAAVIVNSSGIIPKAPTGVIVQADNLIMAAAMAGLGLDISMRSILKIGKKAFVLGVVSSLAISLVSGAVIFILRHF